MRVAQIVFSPTGGTQRVTDIIAAELGNTAQKFDLTKANNNTIDTENFDISIIAVPSYGGRVPTVAAQRLSTLKGNGMNCIIVCVYGNRAYEDTLVELNDVAVQCGFNVIAAIAAVAEHSIVRCYASNRPDAQDSEQLRNFAKKILNKINNNNFDFSSEIPGNRPYKKMGGAGLIPKPNNKCNGCGYCAESCPTQAISMDNPKITDGRKCISCMRCVTQCSQNARSVNSAMVSVVSLVLKKVCSERKDNELFI